jgi:hypothetical protein
VSQGRILYHLVRADFVERVRRYGFLLTLGAILLGGYLLVPPAGASYMVGLHPVDLSTYTYYRGVYNSAWVGSIVAAMSAWLLSLLGFYLVKGSIERDRETAVGQLIAACPLSKVLYIVGKWLSNVAVLVAIVGTMALAAGAMQLIRGEEMRLQLVELLAPFLWLTLPPLVLVAALAVLFETVPALRGGPGNAVYAVAWCALLPVSYVVLPGLSLIEPSVLATLRAEYPAGDFTASQGVNPAWYGSAHTFGWDGIPWTPGIILGRLAWIGAALVVVILAILAFAYVGGLLGEGLLPHQIRKRVPVPAGRSGARATTGAAQAQPVALAAMPVGARRFRFGRMYRAELRLALAGQPWWWYAGAAGWVVAGLLAPVDACREYLLPAAWLWPLLIWSAMGTREVRHRTGELIFSNAHLLRRQLPATWLAGLTVTLVAGSGVAGRLILAGEWPVLLAWAVGAVFIPTLALALGTWSGSGKAFEGLYALLWYVGPLNQLPVLDFMGTSDKALAANMPFYYLAVSVVLIGLAVVGRMGRVAGRQIQRTWEARGLAVAGEAAARVSRDPMGR